MYPETNITETPITRNKRAVSSTMKNVKLCGYYTYMGKPKEIDEYKPKEAVEKLGKISKQNCEALKSELLSIIEEKIGPSTNFNEGL